MALYLIESTHQEQLAEEFVRKLAVPSDARACGISAGVNMAFAQACV